MHIKKRGAAVTVQEKMGLVVGWVSEGGRGAGRGSGWRVWVPGWKGLSGRWVGSVVITGEGEKPR